MQSTSEQSTGFLGTMTTIAREAGALLIQANEYAMTLQYQLSGGRIVDTLIISV